MRGNKRNIAAISPLLVFVCLYLATSLLVGDFYKVPITVAFLVSSVYAVWTTTGIPLDERVKVYSHGAGSPNLMLMIWIFVLAGAFAASAQAMGAIDAAVHLSLQLLPDNLLLGGRCIGGDFYAHASYRVLGNAIPTGEAAGIAAAVATTTGKLPAEVEYAEFLRCGGNPHDRLPPAPQTAN